VFNGHTIECIRHTLATRPVHKVFAGDKPSAPLAFQLGRPDQPESCVEVVELSVMNRSSACAVLSTTSDRIRTRTGTILLGHRNRVPMSALGQNR